MKCCRWYFKNREPSLTGMYQPFSTRVPSSFFKGVLAKCLKMIYKPAGGSKLPFNYTKPQVFIVHNYNFLVVSILTTNEVIG